MTTRTGDLARSGIVGLSPLDVRRRLVGLGWPVVPIVAHDDPRSQSPGKAVTLKRWQRFAEFDAPLPKLREVEYWERNFADRAPGTGIPCGRVVAIDIDLSCDETAGRMRDLAREIMGDTPFCRVGREPRAALVYSAAEPIASTTRKVLDGGGDGIDILAGGKQFVAFGIHPKTRNPYAWTGGESPLTAAPDDAPEISQEQVDAFLQEAAKIVPLTKTGGRGAGNGGDAEILRDGDGIVIDGREAYLRNLVYRHTVAMRERGEPLAADTIAREAFAEFTETARNADHRWSLEHAQAKAEAICDRVRRRVLELPGDARAAPVAPTYPDNRRPLEEAENATRTVVQDFFREHVPEWRRALINHDLAVQAITNPLTLPPAAPDPVHWAARVETGIGKTAIAIEEAAQAVRAGLSVIYAVPTHKLGAELEARFAAAGIVARAYRGVNQEDADEKKPKPLMCRDRGAWQDALDAFLPPMKTVCQQTDKRTGRVFECAHFRSCGIQRQALARPDLWIVPHRSLVHKRPHFIPAPDALVIDERFHTSAFGDDEKGDDKKKAAPLTVDEIEELDARVLRATRDGLPYTDEDDSGELAAARDALVRALRANGTGPLRREILEGFDIDAETAHAARRLEFRRKIDPGIRPGMPARARAEKVKEAARNREARRMTDMWQEIAGFLEGSAERSGRIALRERGTGLALDIRPLKPVHASYRAPALILDATLPDPVIFAPILTGPVEVKADIAARWAPHGTVRQITGAPVSANKLGITKGGGNRKRVIADLLRFIRLRVGTTPHGRRVAVVGQEKLIDELKDAGLDGAAETGHFGGLAGLDHWKDAAGLIVIGRTLPEPRRVEAMASVIAGEPVATIAPEGDEGFHWYPTAPAGLRIADGSTARVMRPYHPDALAEAMRWQSCEAELLQAVGRLRALRRDATSPFFLDIISDVALPITLDTVETWAKAMPPKWAETADHGIIFESATDLQRAFPDRVKSRQEARTIAEGFMVGTSIRQYIHVPTINQAVTYKERGRGKKPCRALLLERAPQDFAAWLAEKLGGDLDILPTTESDAA